MKYMLSAITLILLSSVTAVIPDNVTEFTLSNGIPVISRTVDNNRIEGLSLFITGGSSALTEETQGLERFALECAMMGSEDYPGPRWREMMDRTQAEWTSNFNYDYTRYHLKCISRDLPGLLNAFGDCLLNPELDPEAVSQVRTKTVHDIQQKYNDPDSWIWYVANDAFMPGHTYRRLPDGTVETVEGFTDEDVLDILNRRIRSGKLLITHAGPTSPEELRAVLEEAFGAIPEGGQEYPEIEPFQVSSDTMAVQHRDVASAYAVVKFNAPPQGHPDQLPFSAAMRVISDRLWQVLRTENALTYATYSGSTTYRENWGYMYVSSPKPLEACSLMAGVMRNAIEEPLDDYIVRGTVEKTVTLMNMRAASKSDQCWMMGSYQIATGDWRNAFTEIDNLSEVTSQELSDVLGKWIDNGAWGIIADTTAIDADRLDPWTLEQEMM